MVYPWEYEDTRQYRRRLARQWQAQARRYLNTYGRPYQPEGPTIFDRPLLTRREQKSILGDLPILREPIPRAAQPPGGLAPSTRRPLPAVEVGLPSFPVEPDTLEPRKGGFWETIGLADIEQPWDIFRPAVRLLEAETKYLARPLAKAHTAPLGLIGIQYDEIPGFIRSGLELTFSPSTWIGYGAISKLLAKGSLMAMGAPSTMHLATGLGSRRAIAEVVLANFTFPLGADIGEEVGVPPLAGGLVGTVLGSKGLAKAITTYNRRWARRLATAGGFASPEEMRGALGDAVSPLVARGTGMKVGPPVKSEIGLISRYPRLSTKEVDTFRSGNVSLGVWKSYTREPIHSLTLHGGQGTPASLREMADIGLILLDLVDNNPSATFYAYPVSKRLDRIYRSFGFDQVSPGELVLNPDRLRSTLQPASAPPGMQALVGPGGRPKETPIPGGPGMMPLVGPRGGKLPYRPKPEHVDKSMPYTVPMGATDDQIRQGALRAVQPERYLRIEKYLAQGLSEEDAITQAIAESATSQGFRRFNVFEGGGMIAKGRAVLAEQERVKNVIRSYVQELLPHNLEIFTTKAGNKVARYRPTPDAAIVSKVRQGLPLTEEEAARAQEILGRMGGAPPPTKALVEGEGPLPSEVDRIGLTPQQQQKAMERSFRRPPEEGSLGAMAAYPAYTPAMANIMANLNQMPSKSFQLISPAEVIQEARYSRSITQKFRENLDQNLPQWFKDIINRAGIRLSDSDANILIDYYAGIRSKGSSMAAAAANTAEDVLVGRGFHKGAFQLDNQGNVLNVTPKIVVQTTKAGRTVLRGPKGRFTTFMPPVRPQLPILLSYPHLYNLSPQQQAALRIALAPLEEMRQYEKAFGVKVKEVTLPRSTTKWPVRQDVTGIDLNYRDSIEDRIKAGWDKISNKWLNEGLKGMGTTRGEQVRLGALPAGSKLDTLTSINNAFRGVMATADGSFATLQGIIALANNPKVWAESMRAAILGNMDSIMSRMRDKGSLQLFMDAGLIIYGRSDIGEYMLKWPFTAIPGFRKIATGANIWFGDFGNAVRILLADSALPLAQSQADVRAIARWANLATGVGPGTPHRLEGILFFAPRFMRSQLGLLSDVLTFGGQHGTPQIGRDLARKSLFRLVSLGALLTFAINKALGNETDFDPRSSNFMRIRALDQDWSLFGPWDSLVKAMTITVTDGPEQGAKYWMQSKASPTMGRVYDLMRGTTFRGDPLTWSSPEEIAKSIGLELAEVSMPIAWREAARSIQEAGGATLPEALVSIPFEMAGLKGSTLTFLERRDIIAKEWSGGRKWAQLEPWERVKLEDERPDVIRPRKTEFQKAMAARQDIGRRFKEAQQELDNAFLLGTDWRDARSRLIQQQAGAYQQWAMEHPAVADYFERFKPENPNDQALQDYFQGFSLAQHMHWTPEQLSEYLDTIQARWTPDQAAYVSRNTGLQDTPREREYRLDQQKLRPYWEIADQVWDKIRFRPEFSQYPSLNSYLDSMANNLLRSGVPEHELEARLRRLPIVSRVTSTINRLRFRYRRAHPEVDRLLAKWYGATPIYMRRAS